MMTSEDARSDFVLAAAGAVLVPLLADLVANLPLYPAAGTLLSQILGIGWVGLSLLFVPVVIGRFREQGLAAYSLAGSRNALARVAIIAFPVVLLGFLRAMAIVGPLPALVGRLGIPLQGSPAVGESFDPMELVVRVLYLAVLAGGALVLTGFLIERAKDAFRSPDLPVIEGLRTYGMAAAAASVVFGLLAVVGRGVALPLAIGASVALGATVLLADRFVFPGMSTTRAALLAPAIAAAVFHVLSTGGIFGGDLVLGLWWASLGFGVVIVAGALAKTGATSLAFAVPILAVTFYPTCISPVSLVQGAAGFCL